MDVNLWTIGPRTERAGGRVGSKIFVYMEPEPDLWMETYFLQTWSWENNLNRQRSVSTASASIYYYFFLSSSGCLRRLRQTLEKKKKKEVHQKVIDKFLLNFSATCSPGV